MFEAELEMEKKQGGGFGPVLIIVLMVLVVFGGVGYLVWQGRQTLKPEEAAPIITAAWMEKGPAKVTFHTGLVTPDVNETTSDPHYRLMAKLGLITTKPAKNGSLQADLTPEGEGVVTTVGLAPFAPARPAEVGDAWPLTMTAIAMRAGNTSRVAANAHFFRDEIPVSGLMRGGRLGR